MLPAALLAADSAGAPSGAGFHAGVNPWPFLVAASVAYVAWRVLQARRRGESPTAAAGRAVAESLTVGTVLLGLLLVVAGVTLLAMARFFLDLVTSGPAFLVLWPMMFFDLLLWPMGLMLIVAGVMCMFGGGAGVTAFVANRRVGARRRRSLATMAPPPPPPPPSPPPPLPCPAPASSAPPVSSAAAVPAPRAARRSGGAPSGRRQRPRGEHGRTGPDGRRRPLKAAGR